MIHGFDNTDPTGQVKYYNVKLVATSVNGCTDTAQSYITIYPKVVATIEADTTEGVIRCTVNFLSEPGGATTSGTLATVATQEGGNY